MAAAEPMDQPDADTSRGVEPAVPFKPAGVQGLSAEGKPGAVVELQLRRSHDQLPADVDQLKWQRLAPFEKLADTLLKHLDGIANYCRTNVRMGVVEAVNGNIRMLINRGRGYKNLRYLLLKAKRLAVSNLELLAVRRIVKAA